MIDNVNAQNETDVRAQQLELLQSVTEHLPKVLKELKALVVEFYGIKQSDSDEYLDFVLESVNWDIQAMNGTMDILNENAEVINKEQANQAVLDLNDALGSKVDAKIADALNNGIIPLLEKFMQAAQDIIKAA